MSNSTSHSTLIAQFRTSYPMGSLISELLHIHENQYIVRVQIQTGGIILATALSADPNIETAENQARERAIALLQEPTTLAVSQPEATINQAPQPTPLKIISNRSQPQTSPPEQPPENAKKSLSKPLEKPISRPTPAPEPDREPTPEPEEKLVLSPPEDPIANFIQDTSESPLSIPLPEPEDDFDFSDVSLKIEMELERIKWDSKQEADYLKLTYGKSKRLVLNDEEMKEFLEYLQTYAETTVELERLGWSPQQGKDYLKEKYPNSKSSRMLLSCSEIKEFLSYLQQQESSIHNYI